MRSADRWLVSCRQVVKELPTSRPGVLMVLGRNHGLVNVAPPYLEDHPRTRKWLIPMVSKSPK